MKHLLSVSFLLGFFQLTAQSFNDCISSIFICNKQTIQIGYAIGAGFDDTELNEAPCFFNGSPGNIESNSCWIRFTVAQSGTLLFTITPDTTGDDIDFVLFRLVNGENCQQKEILRCMAAGASFGIDSSACFGPTGLMEGETDTLEDAGCSEPDDNNFLAPVYLLADKTYALCVQNYTYNGFRIEFCGTALLGCEMDTCVVLTANRDLLKPIFRLYRLYPNPTFETVIQLDIETDTPNLRSSIYLDSWYEE